MKKKFFLPSESVVKRFTFILLILFAFTLSLSITASQTFAILALFLTLYRMRLHFLKDPLIYLFLLFFLLSVPSFLLSVSKTDALLSLKGDMLFFIYFLFTKNISERDLPKITLSFLLGALLSSFIGFFTLSAGGRINEPFVSTTFGHFHSMTLLFFLPFLFFLKGRKRWGLLLCTGVIAAGVIFSYTRGAWLSALFCLALFFILRRRVFHLLCFFASITVTLSALLYLLPSYPLSLRAKSVADLHEWKRLQRWAVALCMAREHPLFGIGIASYSRKYEKYLEKVSIKEEGSRAHAHNLYLHILAERGIVGLLGLSMLFFFLLRRVILCAKSKEGFHHAICMGAFLCIVSFLLGGLSEHTWADAELSMLLWFATALASCTENVEKMVS
jgi:O-antigen ligase